MFTQLLPGGEKSIGRYTFQMRITDEGGVGGGGGGGGGGGSVMERYPSLLLSGPLWQ